MKELSIEEKAKRYDEALERARIWKNKSGMSEDKQGILDDIFPGLAESEDERIRKELIDFVKSRLAGFPDCKRFTDWLERQGEHANFRNKIQIGDKVTKNRDGVLVNLSQLNRVAKVEKKQGEQKPTNEEMKTLLQTEYEKGRADAIAEMQESWSDEDKKILKDIITDVKFEGYNNDMQANSYRKISWLKSLKDRVQPQSR